MIIIRAEKESDRHFLVDARYLSIDGVCRCLARLPGVQFTVPLKSCWKHFRLSCEQAARQAWFTFRNHTYLIDDDCPFTGDISVRSEDAPVSDIKTLQDHVDQTGLTPFRRRIVALFTFQWKEAFGHQQPDRPNRCPAAGSRPSSTPCALTGRPPR